MNKFILDKIKANTKQSDEIKVTKECVLNKFNKMIEDLDEFGIYPDRYVDPIRDEFIV